MQCHDEVLSEAFILFGLTHCAYHMVGQHIPDEGEKRKQFAELVELYRQYLYQKGLNESIRENERESANFSNLLGKAKNLGPEVLLWFIVTTVEALGPNGSIFLLSTNVNHRDLKVILGCFSSQRFHGWGIRKGRGLISSLLVHRNNYSHVALLIRNGFPYLFHREYLGYRFEQLQKVEVDGKSLGNQISPSILDSGSLRLQLVLDVLLVLFGNHPQTKDMLELLWQAVPFPYISPTEMFTLLEPFFIEEEEEDIKLWDVCDVYRQRNPLFEVPQVTQPRSLQHLAGVEVRKYMRDAHSIGDDAIDGLDIPKTIKDCLKLPFTETSTPAWIIPI